MPRGMYKSGRLRKIAVSTVSKKGSENIHYRRRKPSRAKCAHCQKQLAGVPRELPAKMANLPKTVKRPERPYGGKLCSSCTRKLLRQQVGDEQWVCTK